MLPLTKGTSLIHVIRTSFSGRRGVPIRGGTTVLLFTVIVTTTAPWESFVKFVLPSHLCLVVTIKILAKQAYLQPHGLKTKHVITYHGGSLLFLRSIEPQNSAILLQNKPTPPGSTFNVIQHIHFGLPMYVQCSNLCVHTTLCHHDYLISSPMEVTP